MMRTPKKLAALIMVLAVSGCSSSLHFRDHNAHESGESPTAGTAQPTVTPMFSNLAKHTVQIGVPLTIGPGYTCVNLGSADSGRWSSDQHEFMPLPGQKADCAQQVYVMQTKVNHIYTLRATIRVDAYDDIFNAQQEELEHHTIPYTVFKAIHECETVLTVMPKLPPDSPVPGRLVSVMVVSYLTEPDSRLQCDLAQGIMGQLIDSHLG